MAGILDSKSRIMDVVITEQGRRQIASGKMKIEYATFTDIGSFYQQSGSIIDDPSNRIYFEAASDLPSDLITFETDDSGLLIPYRSDNFVASGKNLSISGSSRDQNDTTGSAEAITQAIFESWKNLQVIGSDDPLDDNQEFTLSRNSAAFSIRDAFPFTESDVSEAVVDDVESLFNDFRLSNLDNFKYLPPVNSKGVLSGSAIGNFPNTNEIMDLNTQAFESRLAGLEYIDFDFVNTSIENNFLMQIFEVSNDDGIIKLDVIDYGEKRSGKNKKRTLFAGKILKDAYGNPTFVNIFTIELE
jgi:hypothetical protein